MWDSTGEEACGKETTWINQDNAETYCQVVGREGMEWIKVAQDTDRRRALVNVVINGRVP
jgi:hypothetical protein